MKDVAIYTTPTCHFCHMAKDFFKEKGISYSEYNVASDEMRRDELLEITGKLAVPVIKIGEDYMVGFSRTAVEEALGIKG